MTMVLALWLAVAADGAVIASKEYSLPSYEAALGIQPYATRPEYEAAVNDKTFALDRVEYASDGLTVVAYTYAPRERSGKRYPTIVFNRGSYIQGEIAHQLLPMFHRLALRGFVVVAPLYRGSASAPGNDEMGGAELHDLMNVVPLGKALGFVDTERLYLYGESRGGMMTFLAIKSGFPAKAAATFGAFTDLGALLAAAPRRYEALIAKIWPDFPARREEILHSRSAVEWPEALKVPLLLMHGGADRDVDAAQTLRLALRLQQAGHPYELRVFGGDTHVLPNHRVERDQTAAQWFGRHRE
ncbi:MAG: prolyl oligopeptidase family serine peptidase [Candidatus Solibacter usitatus]|nr:prolyl oligopeptidase family serine peptidase [Candidatus Solibacter usitatus]